MEAGTSFLKMADHLAGGLMDVLDFNVEKSINLKNLGMFNFIQRTKYTGITD